MASAVFLDGPGDVELAVPPVVNRGALLLQQVIQPLPDMVCVTVNCAPITAGGLVAYGRNLRKSPPPHVGADRLKSKQARGSGPV